MAGLRDRSCAARGRRAADSRRATRQCPRHLPSRCNSGSSSTTCTATTRRAPSSAPHCSRSIACCWMNCWAARAPTTRRSPCSTMCSHAGAGRAPGRQARDADELAVLVDRAGDLTSDELRARVAPEAEWRSGDPLTTLLDSRRVIGATLSGELRLLLVDAYPLYTAAFGSETLGELRVGRDLVPSNPDVAVPESLRTPSLTPGAARREILSRFLALAGPVSAGRRRPTSRFRRGMGSPSPRAVGA